MEVKIDYLSVTFPLNVDASDSVLFTVHDMVKFIATYLNVGPHEINKEMYAQNNFNYQYTLGENMILRLDGPLDECYQKTCHFELKGDGCREFEVRNEDKNWVDLIFFFVSLNGRFKRLDLAIDDYEGKEIQLDYLYRKVREHQYTSVFKSNPRPIGTLEDGLTIQFGSNKSDTELVIYDKLKERIHRRKAVTQNYWVRYEMRFRGKNAEKIVCLIIDNYDNLSKIAFEQLYRILDIKEENSYSIREQSRVPTDINWKSFLQGVEKGVVPKSTFDKKVTFENYLKAATPYITTFLLYKYYCLHKTPELFEIEIYKFLKYNIRPSKKTFKNLNIYLSDLRLKPIDDLELNNLKDELNEIIKEKELPF